MNLTLAAGIAALLLWAVLLFAVHVESGTIHLLYAAAAVLIARRIVAGAPRFLS